MAETKPNTVFRQAALDRLTSPEQLHTLMRVTDAKGWLALLGCGLIIVTALVWGTLGRIQTKVAAGGILLGGAGLTEITSPGEGDVVSIEVQAGDVVKKGQVVAKIAQAQVAQQIDELKLQIHEADQDADAGTMTAEQDANRNRLKGDLKRLKRQLKESFTVVSTVEGRVVEVRAMAGEHLTAGKPIVAMEIGHERTLEALLYFDSHEGKALKPGMRIEISPSVVKKERHGVMLGRVKAVEDYPSTRAGMMGALRNEQLVDSFIQEAGGAPIAVRAEILPDRSTRSGYLWSSGKGPDLELTSGTRCAGAVITRTQRPIALVFPALDYGG